MATEWAIVYVPKMLRSLGVLKEISVTKYDQGSICLSGQALDQEHNVEVKSKTIE
jgi:hypothetical protein